MRPTDDIVILGGGLAGLTLALQARQLLPDAGITVLEKNAHPVPEAIHKVGESSVEIAAHYFDTVLGLQQHLAERQLKKFGFRFFFSDARRDIDSVTELGPSRYLTTPSYQIDRGIFENFLGGRVREAGVRFLDGCTILGASVGDGRQPHEVTYRYGGRETVTRPRWLVDASGRAGIIKKALRLGATSPHTASAVWFRMATRIDVDQWAARSAWHDRCDPPARWLSTNHLVGAGYWVWLIPLSSGSHSVGIVADPRRHPLGGMNSFDKALAWLDLRQPRLAEELRASRGLLQDFSFFRRVPYGCSRLFSGKRWAITGEAGVFLDPFYSPGGDFIAIANTYIADLIARDARGEPIESRAVIYERTFRSFYESTLTLYVDQYGLFGDPLVMPLKVLWDYTYYWGILCQLFFQRRLTDLRALGALRDELQSTQQLNIAMQGFLRQWSGQGGARDDGAFLDQAGLAWFAELNRGLRDPLDDAQFERRMRNNCGLLHALAEQILHRATVSHPDLAAAAREVPIRQHDTGPADSLLFSPA